MALLILITLSAVIKAGPDRQTVLGQRATKVQLVQLCQTAHANKDQILPSDEFTSLLSQLSDTPRRRHPAVPERWACSLVSACEKVFSRPGVALGRNTKLKKRRWRDDRDLDAALADAAFGGGWRAAPGASVVDAPDCVVAGDAEATAARLRYLQRTAPPGSPADACTLRWRPPRVAPPPPPPGQILFRDSDFAVLRDAYTGSVAVASRTEVTNTPPLTLV